MNILKPFLRYQGNKFKLIPWLHEYIKFDKDTQSWIEPFLGSGSVLFNFQPIAAVASDINPHIISTLKIINNKRHLDEFFVELEDKANKLLEHKVDFFYQERENFNKQFNAASFILLNISCFNGICRYNSKGEFNASFCKNEAKLKHTLPLLKKKFYELNKILDEKGDLWAFLVSDYKEVMKISCKENSVCYLDPPYFNKNVGYYANWTKEDALELLNLMNTLPGEFYLSSCVDDRDESILDLIPFKYEMWSKSHTYIVGGTGSRRYETKEVLIRKI